MLLHHAYLSGDLERFKGLLKNEKDTTFRHSGASKQKGNKVDVNAVDSLGRTVLHLASSEGKIEFVEALLSNHLVDVAKPDRESGWTALHRALYAGQIVVARAVIARHPIRSSALRDLLNASDAEANTSFDVYNATVSGVNPSPQDVTRGASDFFSFGSNANHTLGFSDADDRAFPERVAVQRPGSHVDVSQNFRQQRIRDVYMSKYHTLVMTADSHLNLYSCGFAKHGRLGVKGGTRFTLNPIDIPGQIVAAAAAQDHSLAVNSDGDLFSWGSQQDRQLGHEIEIGTSFIELPRKVIKLAKERVIGVAASSIHSVCFTATSLYTWGRNEGQLGYELNPQEGPLVILPRKVTALSAAVKQVAATRYATCCLVETDDVLIFTNYGYFKLSLQLDRFAAQYQVFRPRQSYAPSKIVKVTSGFATIAVMTNMGDVFSFVLDETTSGCKPASLAKVIKPARVWSLRKKHMAVRDVAVGQEGTMIMCTESGSVYLGTKRSGKQRYDASKGEYKFSRQAGITRIVQVRASNHGAFGLIRADVPLLPVVVNTTDLPEDLLCILPYSGSILEEDDPILDNDSTTSDDDRESVGDVAVPKHFTNACEMLRDAEIANTWDLEAGTQDMVFKIDHSGFELPVHRVICCARSAGLKDILLHGKSITGLEVVRQEGEIYIQILDSSIDLVSLVVVVHWLYTDLVLNPWIGASNSRHKAMQKAMEGAKILALQLQLRPLAKALSQSFVVSPKPSLSTEIGKLTSEKELLNLCDLRLLLADGEILTHSVVLAARSEFFAAMVSGAWISARRDESCGTVVDIDVKHISSQVMSLVLMHVFHDQDMSLFENVNVGDLDEYLDLVISVLAAATEFILPRLKQVCQAVLRRYVHRKNVAIMLYESDRYSADELKEACLDYCAKNLQLLLENHLLADLGEDLMHDLELYIARKQVERLPVSKSGELLSQLVQRHPYLLDEAEEIKQSYLKSLLVSPFELGRGEDIPASVTMTRKASTQMTPNNHPESPRTVTKAAEDTSFIFDMDDYDLTELDGRVSSLKLPEVAPTITSVHKSTKPVTELPTSNDPAPADHNQQGIREAGRGWSAAVPTTPVTDLRSVLGDRSPKSPITNTGAIPSTASRASQRDRKRQVTVESPGSSAASVSPWALKASAPVTPFKSISEAQQSSPRAVPIASSRPIHVPHNTHRPVAVPHSSPAARGSGSYSKSYLAASPSPSPGQGAMSLAEIIAAEQNQKQKVVDYNAKRSMKEIQEQEEFERWFQLESVRVQKEQEASLALAARLQGQEQKSQSKEKKSNSSKSKAKPKRKAKDDSIHTRDVTVANGSSPKMPSHGVTQLKANASEFTPGRS